MTTKPRQNLLSRETSPYLLQHAENPVHWMPWGPEAFEAARAANRPIILSIGYAACHWCHVMAHESFEDETVAEVMNRHFISIKVDREERPDVDQIYQHALALLGQNGGWPLTMFLTPTGEPFWGGTYFPRNPAYGRPGFIEILERITHIYETEPEKVAQNRDGLAREIAKLGRSGASGEITPSDLDDAARRIASHIDPERGGLGNAPKFPQPFLYEFLWRRWLANGQDNSGQENLKSAVITTLDHMADGGIYDHLGGGFARYSVDADWLVPHFEKMLYDNALLVSLYTLVWQETGKPIYKQRVEETIGWMDREMSVEDGGFAAAIDADSEGREGAFYVWQADDITAILDEDAPAFLSAYGVTKAGNWEGANILNRLHRVGEFDDKAESRMARLRAQLLKARDNRPRPGRDHKVLADWNGLAIEALVRAGQAFDQPDWIDRARVAFAFIVKKLSAGKATQNRIPLHHSYCAGRARHMALLDDYANMAAAALALHEATGDAAFLDHARGWVDIVHKDFGHKDDFGHKNSGHEEESGYFSASRHAKDLIVRPHTIHDTAVPAGNATMIRVLTILYHMTGDGAYRSRAETIIRAFGGEIARSLIPLTSFLSAAESFMNGIQIVIRGSGPIADNLVRVVHTMSLPGRVLQVLDEQATLPATHPANGKGLVTGQPAAYVCRGQTCSTPITDPAILESHLRSLRSAQT